MISLSFKLILIYSVTFGVASFFYRSEIMEWRFEISGNDLLQTSKSFGLLMFCFISITATYIFGTLLTANGSLKILNIVALAGVIMNIALNLYLIPEYGAYGAAIASLITQAITALAQIILALALVPFRLEMTDTVKIVSFTILISIAAYGSSELSIHWSLRYIAVLFSGAVLGWLSGMLSIKGLINILQSKED